ncbi:MAG: ABC transporter permease [Propionibacteriaceae bacterium]|nr:ABC transporter permease [Propionibacteriaceae bacterium]
MKGLTGFNGRPARFVASVLAVLLGVAFMSGTVIVRASMTSTAGTLLDSMVSADAYVLPHGAMVSDLLMKPSADQEFLDSSATGEVLSVQEVQGAMAVFAGPVVLTGADGNPVPSGAAPSIGVGADTNQVQSGRLVDGVWPSGPSEMALEQNTATKAGLSIGDTGTLIANGTILDMTVTGIVSYDSSLGGAVVVVLNGIVARAIFSPSGMIPFIAVKAQDGVSPQQLVTALSSSLPASVNADVTLGTDARAQAMAQIHASWSLVNTALLVLAIVAVLVGFYVVVTVVAGMQRSRYAQIAVAKTMGGTSKELLGPLLGQAVIVGLIGAVLGIVAGLGLTGIVGSVTARTGLSLAVSLPWLWLVVCLLVGVVIAVLGAWVGSARASSVDHRQMAENSAPTGKTGFGVVRLVVGVLLLVAGVVIAIVGVSGTANLWLAGCGVVVTLVGAVLVAPVVVAVLSRVFAQPLRLFSSLSAQLAKSHILRQPRRASNVAGVFVVSVALAAGVLILADSAQASTSATLSHETRSDVILQSTDVNGVIADAVVAKVRQLAGIQVSAYGQAPVKMEQPDPSDPSQLTVVDGNIMFGPPETFVSVVDSTVVAGNADDFPSGMAVTQTFATAHDLHVGDMVDLVTARNSPYEVQSSLPVALIVDSVMFTDIMVSSSWLIQQVPGHTRSQFMPVTTLLITAMTPGDAASVQDQLVTAVEPFHTISVMSHDDYVAGGNQGVNQAKIAIYALLALSAIIAIVALVSILGLAVAERGREISVLKAMGATGGQIRRMISFEAVLIAASGAFFGLVVGVGLSFVGQRALSGVGMTGWSIPWLWLVVIFVASIVVAVLGAILPSVRAAKLPAVATTA